MPALPAPGAGTLSSDEALTRAEELLARVASGRPLGSVERELALFDDIASVARDASICGLGQTACSAAGSAVRLGLIGGNGKESA